MDVQDLQTRSIKRHDDDQNYSQFHRSVFGDGNLWIKLKMPKNEEQESNQDEHISNGFREMKINRNNIRVCRFCNKVFSSGKALGGHMRIHVDPNKDLVLKKKFKPHLKPHQEIKKVQERVLDFVKEKKYEKLYINQKQTCMICGKDFPSEKSLFGHMRCHPERDWRGIQPPTMARKTPARSSSDDDDNGEAPKVDYLVDSWVDLTQSLKGWSVTAKRGRKLTPTSASEVSSLEHDDQLLDAVNDLMMLAQGDLFETDLKNRRKANDFQVVKSTSPAGIGDISPPEKKLVKEEEEEEVCIDELDTLSFGNHLETSDMTMKNLKKRRKRVKLSDLEVVSNATPNPMNDRYHCNTCDKSFKTYQALGGHRSGHKRCKIWDEEDDEEFSNPAVQLADETKESEASNVCRRSVLIDFDLNEIPLSEDEIGIESQLVVSN